MWKECSDYRRDKICFLDFVLKNAVENLKSVCPPRKSTMVFKITIDVFSFMEYFLAYPFDTKKKMNRKLIQNLQKSQNLMFFDIQGSITRHVPNIANKFKHKLCINTFLFDRKPLEFITFHAILRYLAKWLWTGQVQIWSNSPSKSRLFSSEAFLIGLLD